MNTLEHAFEKRQTVTSKPRQNVLTPVSSGPGRTIEDVLNELRVGLARKEEQAAVEATIEKVSDLFAADETLTAELSELSRRRTSKGSFQGQENQKLIEKKTDDQKLVRAKLVELQNSDPSSYEEGKKRYNIRQDAVDMADSNLQHSPTAANIRARIVAALEAAPLAFLVITDDRSEAEFSFGREHYKSPWPDDPSVSRVAKSLKKLVADLQAHHQSDDKAIRDELVRGGFFISTQREPDASIKGKSLDSELDLLRKAPGTVKSPSLFLNGHGTRYITRINNKEFIVLENRDGLFFATGATGGSPAGRALCTVPADPKNRESKARMCRTEPANIARTEKNVPVKITATDLSGIWYEPLRLALEADLLREAESITFADLKNNVKGTCSVSISWTTKKGEPASAVHLSFELRGEGNGTFTARKVYSDMVQRVDPRGYWLARAVAEPQPLEVLNKVPAWQAVAGLNKEHERDWQLARTVEKFGAARISKENLTSLIGVEGGQDGIYAVRVNIGNPAGVDGNGKKKYEYKPMGFIVEHKGSKVKIVWAVPGTSVNFANNLRDEYEVSDLPWRLKQILGTLSWAVTTKTPDHLKLSSKQKAEADRENPTEE